MHEEFVGARVTPPQAVHPDLVFLSEAFTRPALMATLAADRLREA